MTTNARVGVAIAVMSTTVGAQGLTYPVTRTVDHVDTYHGVQVPDPYRWLEDDTSADVPSSTNVRISSASRFRKSA